MSEGMVKQQRMTITRAERGDHPQFGPVTKVHLEAAESRVVSSKRALEVLVAELLVLGHDKVTVGDVVQLNVVEALQ